jgi:hypothetical protein
MSERHSGTGAPAPYEKADVSIRGIVLFTVGLAVATALSMWLMGGLFRQLDEREAREAEAIPPTTRVPGARPQRPPEPVLQGAPGSRFELQDPIVEMQAWRRHEDELLSSSGWIDRNAGTVRIPIDQAKRLLLERGLDVRGETSDGERSTREASSP